jgi:hypothetical protein
MNPSLLVLLIALCAPFTAFCGETAPAIAFFTESMGLVAPGTDRGPRFVTAVWSDGRIVWSRDPEAGGAPYLTARIEPERIQQLLKRFEERGVFAKGGPRRSWFGPDSSYQTIWLSSGERHLRLETWHELIERNPKLVVTNGSAGALDGRSREEVIRGDTKEFREFRQLWSDLRAAISALVPAAGEPYSGAMTFKLPR